MRQLALPISRDERAAQRAAAAKRRRRRARRRAAKRAGGYTTIRRRAQPAVRLPIPPELVEHWSTEEIADVMKVSNRTVQRWIVNGIPADRCDTLAVKVFSQHPLEVWGSDWANAWPDDEEDDDEMEPEQIELLLAEAEEAKTATRDLDHSDPFVAMMVDENAREIDGLRVELDQVL